MLVGIVATLFAPEPSSDMVPHKPHAGFVETIWAPIHELLKRLGPMAVAILLLVAGFRMPGYIASAMAVPLFKHQGFTNTDIATVTKVFGFWIALGGTFMAGWLIPRIGMMSSLLIGTVAGSASHLALALLAAHGGDGGKAFWTFALAVGVEGFAYAFASIVLITYMSTLASVEHAASQFGLLDLALRLSRQHSGRVLGLRDRAYRLRLVLHLDLADRHPGRAAGGLCLVPRRDIGRGADPGRGRALRAVRLPVPHAPSNCNRASRA